MTLPMVPGDAAREAARFFPGQLVGPDDLAQDQVYFRERLRRHNRLLHGWGIAVGAGVSPGPGPGTVTVGAGLVLAPTGDEIWIESDVVVDLCSADADGSLVVAGAPVPPPAGAVPLEHGAGDVLHLAVRYVQRPTNPVRVPGALCGCDAGGDSGATEHTRLRDSYAFAALDRLPDGYDPMPAPDVSQVFGQTAATVPCPPVPRDPWVVLGDVTMRAAQEVGAIDLYSRRRHAPAWWAYYFLNPPSLVGLTAPDTVPNSTPFPVTVTLDGPSPDDQTLGLSADPPIVSLPSPSPVLPRGQSGATFELAAQSLAAAPVPVTLSVSYHGTTRAVVVTVQPGPVG